MSLSLHFDHSKQRLQVIIEDHRPSDDGSKTFLRTEAKFESLEAFGGLIEQIGLKEDEVLTIVETLNGSGDLTHFGCRSLEMEGAQLAALGFPEMTRSSRAFLVSYSLDAQSDLIRVTATMINAPLTVRSQPRQQLFTPTSLTRGLAQIDRTIAELHDERLALVPERATMDADDLDTLFWSAEQ